MAPKKGPENYFDTITQFQYYYSLFDIITRISHNLSLADSKDVRKGRFDNVYKLAKIYFFLR